MKHTDIIIIVSWAIFVIYWFLSSLQVKAIAEKQSWGSAMQHRLPLGLSCFLLLAHKLPAPLNTPLIPRSPGWQLTGAIVCALGLFVTIWARRTLAGNWSSDVTFKQGHELVKSGPYRFARHPIYTGLLIMFLGTAVHISAVRAWLALIIVFAGFWIKLRQEEKLLIRHFPETYPAYQTEVKALVPFVI